MEVLYLLTILGLHGIETTCTPGLNLMIRIRRQTTEDTSVFGAEPEHFQGHMRIETIMKEDLCLAIGALARQRLKHRVKPVQVYG